MTIPHLHLFMTANSYIQTKLNELKQPLGLLAAEGGRDALVAQIVKLLLSKKFRKYSAKPELIEHIWKSVRLHVEKQEPLEFTFFHGAYKLWRLDEAPDPDWAELFALLHYSNWLKPVCEIYQPGVRFDFFVDDLIVPKLNNVSLDVVTRYIDSYQKLIDFVHGYQPENMSFTITPVGSLFASPEAFDESVAKNLEKLTAELPGGVPILDEQHLLTVELNVRASDEQKADPQWREKVQRLHDAYMISKAGTGYTKDRPDKILTFVSPLPAGMTLSLGTTKDSIMKFWVGVGVLKPDGDGFRQVIISWRQLQEAHFTFEDTRIAGLDGKNFQKIRVLGTAAKALAPSA
ncbi:MAG TPA: hypothetical protein VLF71_05810 [Candidatus Saccharimonadales bacterium]|nr:hypothetical protein [Candidatus Saccharimonadales bacterium]